MASLSIEPIQAEASRPVTPIPLPWRIVGLATLFVTELFLISARTPHLALQDTPGLPGLVFELGRWKVRLLVTLAVVCLLFWQARGKGDLQRLSTELSRHGIAWRWLFTHLATAFSFASLTSILFENRFRGFQADLLVVGWVAVGGTAMWLGAIAFFPGSFWKAMFRGTGDLWAYIAALVIGGSVLATCATPLWQVMARWTLMLSSLMLRLFPMAESVDISAMTIKVGTFALQVAPACSGYEGIGLILAFTSAWLWFFRKEWRFPHALLLIPAGIATIWFFNAMRVAALLMIGATASPEIAMQGFHSHAGWIAFNIVALGTCLAARRIPALSLASGAEPTPLEGVGATPVAERNAPNPTLPFLLPFLAILAAGMLAGAASSGFEWLYILRVAAAAAALWCFRHRYRTLNWKVSWPSAALGVLVFLVWIGLEPLVGSPRSGEPIQLAQASEWARTAWLVVRILGAVVTVPIAEELAFRGFLLRRLFSADFESVPMRAFAWAPFLISSIAFGLLHGERWLAGTIAGMIYALATMRRGRIGEAVAAHAITNALLAVYVLTSGNWQLW